MAYRIGDRIGDYEIVDVLGAGGMGKVYKVRNVISERIEALKVLLPNLESDPELADRFMREIKVQASLQHPNIAALHTALRVDNQLLMLLEYVEGVTVEAEMRRTKISVVQGIGYVRQVLSALSYAHQHGVIHRDIKPANMMLTPSGGIKLMDFGIAKIAQDRKLTQTGRTVGSLYYMSPEQIQGAIDLDPRSDLYSLGVSLYEIVTNCRPFEGDSDYSIMAAHLGANPVPPIQVDPQLPAMLNDVILMSISKDPAQRFQTADAFRAALGAVEKSLGAQPVPSTTARVAAPSAIPLAPSSVPPAPAPKSRRGLYMALGSLVTITVLVVAALQFSRRTEASNSPATSSPIVTRAPDSGLPDARPATSGSAAPATSLPINRAESAPVLTPPNSPQSRPTQQIAQKPATVIPGPTPQRATTQEPAVQQAPAQTPQASVSPPVDAAKVAMLRELREQYAMLATRATSLRTALAGIKQQQARQGLGMRGDIVTSESRMGYQLDEAEDALKAGDPVRMKRTLDLAEREIEKVEKFLGR